MNKEMLFKYRSTQNWKFLLDIFLNKRLYAATYRELNDPMEGRYYYHGDDVSREFRDIIRNKRQEWKICSLSRTHRNTLMWAYYADGHRGITLGLTVRSPRKNPYIVRDVSYDMEVRVSGAHHEPAQIALEILSQKQLAWQHEDEVRVFTQDRFVEIEIQKVCFGCYTDEIDRKLIKALAKRTSPGVKFVDLKLNQLDMPLDSF